jgi:hypothetical protein
LLNGAALARTFLDLLLSSLRAVGVGGKILLRLENVGKDRIAFEISHDAISSGFFGSPGSGNELEDQPALHLAHRTVQSCGGKLSVDVSNEGMGTLRILLPRNATDPAVVRELAQ